MAILSTSVYDLVSGRYGGLPLRSTISTQRIKSFGHHGGSVSGDPYTGLLPKCMEDVNVRLENQSITKKVCDQINYRIVDIEATVQELFEIAHN